MKVLLAKAIGIFLNFLSLVLPQTVGKIGFHIMCSPSKRSYSQREKAFLTSGIHFDISFNNKTCKIYKWGKGKNNIVLLHGRLSNSCRWNKYIHAFDQEQYTIFAMDAPGHGESDKDYLTLPLYSEAITLVLKHIGKVHTVLAHGLGSCAAFYAFYRQPQYTPSKFIAMATSGGDAETLENLALRLSLSAKTIALIEERYLSMTKWNSFYFNAEKFSASLRNNGLLVHDEEDRRTSVEYSKRIHKAWANSRILITSGYGHNLCSAYVVRRVMEFVENNEIIDYERTTSHLQGTDNTAYKIMS